MKSRAAATSTLVPHQAFSTTDIKTVAKLRGMSGHLAEKLRLSVPGMGRSLGGCVPPLGTRGIPWCDGLLIYSDLLRQFHVTT